VFFVADDHAESTVGNITVGTAGSETSPCFTYCVRRTGGSVPPVSADLRTGATITASQYFILSGAQYNYFYGLTFAGGYGLLMGHTGVGYYERCHFKIDSALGDLSIYQAAYANTATWENCTVQFGATNDKIVIGGNFVWRNTANAIQGAVIPASALLTTLDEKGKLVIEGVDFSALGSGTKLFQTASTTRTVLINDCKIGSGVTIADTPAIVGADTLAIRVDSGDTNYRSEKHSYSGSLTTETTIVRTGGASDGTTPIAWKVVTTANSERIYPFEAFPISVWNETVGSSVTVTVECRGAAIPNLDEMWMDVEFLGTSGYPLGNFSTTGHADLLATGTANTSSSETWGGSTASFKLVKAITPQEKGPITVYVKVAKASSTYYIDPKVTLS
jgi:hypothetical protein